MGRIYSVGAENITLGTGNVLLAFQTNSGVGAGSNIGIRRIEVGQSGSTTAAQIRAALSTRNTSGTLTMTSVTPQPLSPVTGPASGLSGNTAPAGAVARIGINSSADSGGTYTDHYYANFNNLNGWLWIPTPPEMIDVPPSILWCLRLLATPGTTTGWSFNVIFEELT